MGLGARAAASQKRSSTMEGEHLDRQLGVERDHPPLLMRRALAPASASEWGLLQIGHGVLTSRPRTDVQSALGHHPLL